MGTINAYVPGMATFASLIAFPHPTLWGILWRVMFEQPESSSLPFTASSRVSFTHAMTGVRVSSDDSTSGPGPYPPTFASKCQPEQSPFRAHKTNGGEHIPRPPRSHLSGVNNRYPRRTSNPFTLGDNSSDDFTMAATVTEATPSRNIERES